MKNPSGVGVSTHRVSESEEVDERRDDRRMTAEDDGQRDENDLAHRDHREAVVNGGPFADPSLDWAELFQVDEEVEAGRVVSDHEDDGRDRRAEE